MKKKLVLILALSPLVVYAQKDTIKTRTIKEVVFQKNPDVLKSNDLTAIKIANRDVKNISSITGGVEDVLKMYPGVNSNTELSSQYMVRGGNYDENLIYINDIEIYRPFLIRNSQQEGMSIINPDMVSVVNFSAGGFEARYGDKMSSALSIYYRQPKKFELSGEASLIGGRLTAGLATKNKKLSVLLSARYRNTDLILNTLKEDTDFNPEYFDFQSYINYSISDKWKISFLGILSKNDYNVIPRQATVNFGTVNQPITMKIGYYGQEDDSYRNFLGTLSVQFKPHEKWNLTLDNFAYQNREKEYYTISSAYRIQKFDEENGLPIENYDLGGQIDHARNDVLIRTYGMQLKGRYSPNVNTTIELGVKLEKENIQDLTNEWKYLDSLGYNVANRTALIDPSRLRLKYAINGDNSIEPIRMSAYAQATKKIFWGPHKVYVNAGVRAQYWEYNQETLVSPRLQFAFKPDWKTDMLFRISGGVYNQAPFYKEIKDISGNFNSSIKAQRSYQIILGHDYEFEWSKRPFKLTTEAYYKKMERLIPYYMDNVRIRYSGKNDAEGYSYGIDTRLFGEFVPGIDSYISASYARTYENIDYQGYIPRPTDQRFRVALFYQDYMPKFPSMRVNLTLVYASGLPTGTPLQFTSEGAPDFNSAYIFQKNLPSYKRVDLGLTKVFIDSKDFMGKGKFWRNFKELSLGVQVYNVFNINNTIASHWISDVNSSSVYAVPVRLTGRFFNVKLNFKL